MAPIPDKNELLTAPTWGPFRVPVGVLAAIELRRIQPEELAYFLGNVSIEEALRLKYGHRQWTYELLWTMAERLNVPIKALV